MKRSTLLAALVAMLGTTALVAPEFAMAQDSTATTTQTAPAADNMHGGMGMRGPMFDFAAMDADKDGKVTEAEMTAWRAAQIAGLDADKDGKITEAELTAHIQAQLATRAADMAKARIAAQDVDGDGALSAAELATPPMQAKIFSRLDTDGDGAVTQVEMDAAKAKTATMMGQKDGRDGGGGWFGRHHRGGHMRGMMDGQMDGMGNGPDGGSSN